MKHQVPWSKTLLEDFIEEGLLSDEEAELMWMEAIIIILFQLLFMLK